jgi:DNA (cytosine-5)-methyltransferase 1
MCSVRRGRNDVRLATASRLPSLSDRGMPRSNSLYSAQLQNALVVEASLWLLTPRASWATTEGADLLTALDFYSGVGGWSLGFRLAGIQTLGSYEWCEAAVETSRAFLQHDIHLADVRALDPTDLPADVSVIVGSPPCTEFSFSNRGGNGDISEGLRDVVKFLEIVDHVRPKYWAMENVPRVGRILGEQIEAGGILHRFAHLFKTISVVNMAEYGLPQARRRMLAGNFPVRLLNSYADTSSRMSMRQVLDALREEPARDSIYGISVSHSNLRDNEHETPLQGDELRMNRDAKTFHPVYNYMEFPDDLDQPSRTITATCTRMTRESIIIADPSDGRYRRLTLRERAMMQGFPITMPFGGRSFNERLRLIGNAIPPPMAYLIAHAMLETPPEKLPLLEAKSAFLPRAETRFTDAIATPPRERYPVKRSFRAAIPNLHFHSGVRFELANTFTSDKPNFTIRFIFGDHLRVLTKHLDDELKKRLTANKKLAASIRDCKKLLEESCGGFAGMTAADLQSRWNKTSREGIGPYEALDALGSTAEKMTTILSKHLAATQAIVLDELVGNADQKGRWSATAKLMDNAPRIVSGLVLGTWFNCSTTLGSPGQSLGQKRQKSLPERDRLVLRNGRGQMQLPLSD